MTVPGSALQYGQVTLDLIGTGDLVRQPVYDDSGNYRYTLWTIPVLGWFNPATNAYALPGGGQAGGAFGDPISAAGQNQLPAITDVALRRYLMEPRRVLTYSVGDNIVLQTPLQQADKVQFNLPGTSPNVAFKADATTGPTPRYCRVTRVSGRKTFQVSYVIEAAVVEDELFTASPSVMLSHTWAVSSNLDENFYETRVIRGTATFRVDLLLARGNVPDDFRAYLSQPIENGFKRDSVDVDILEDGTGVRYTVVDRRKALSVVADSSVSRVEATMASNVYKPSNAIAAMGGIIPLVSAGGYLQIAQVVGNIIAAAVPRMGIEITARVWGKPNANKTTLSAVAFQIMTLKLSGVFGGVVGAARGAMAGSTTSILWDMAGRYVEAHAIVQSPTLNVGGNIDVGTISIPDVRSYMPGQDDIAGVLVGGALGNALPDNDKGMRGDSLTSLVSAALRQPYAAPVSGQAINVARQVPNPPPSPP